MKTWIYSWVFYPFVFSLARIYGLFNRKVRKTLELRSWKDFLSLRFNAGQPIEYWVHVASQGELEYAIPILQELNRRKKKVLITYYSISAQSAVGRLRADLPNVSLVVPLPHDGLGLMKEFVRLVKQQGTRRLLLLKYELWPGLLWECNREGIRVYLVDALKPGWFHRKLIHKLDGILSGYASETEGFFHRNVHVVGDTRVERVLERAARRTDELARIQHGNAERADVLVCGSMWPKDSDLVLRGIESLRASGRKLPTVYWVPHELDETEGKRVGKEFAKLGYKVFSWDQFEGREDRGLHLSESTNSSSNAIIVMKKGILAELYHLGARAYVGGGFGSGVHSVWEPALAGAIVACGPRTRRSPESQELRSRGLLAELETGENFARWFADRFAGGGPAIQASVAALVKEHAGASKRIVDICTEECDGERQNQSTHGQP
ncbi:MAG: hypothetical protein HYW49_11665 [Deltaproteobacteria bacterium]|nr:hypothetical protein [Deltaproteobacteria bacterium]